VDLVGAQPQGRAAWWSGRGDNSFATLTRAFDLRGLERATLRFDAWFEIERHYDYAFVSISTDGGATWHTLPGRHTSSDDPHGANYGHGLTGVSGLPEQPTSIEERGAWVEEEMDLTPYVGQEVLLRFWQVNDEGFNAPGLLVDNIRIPELDYADDVEAGADGWQAEGFVRVDGTLAQQWELRLVRTAADGTVTVETLQPDATGRATAPLAAEEQAVLVVLATTPHTTEPATYRVAVE
jgi:bacillopeptidase F (M6 metalloprotease family)